jgi:hypothetical protein
MARWIHLNRRRQAQGQLDSTGAFKLRVNWIQQLKRPTLADTEAPMVLVACTSFLSRLRIFFAFFFAVRISSLAPPSAPKSPLPPAPPLPRAIPGNAPAPRLRVRTSIFFAPV